MTLSIYDSRFTIYQLFSVSVSAVFNLHLSNTKTCQHEHDCRDENQTRNCQPGGGRLSHDSERPFRNGHGRERMQVVNDAQLFEHWRQQEIYELPPVKKNRRNNRIAEETADDQKDR